MDMTPAQFLAFLIERNSDNPNALAARSKVTQSTIFRFLNGQSREPRKRTLDRIARIYNVPIEAFYSDRARNDVIAKMTDVQLSDTSIGKLSILDKNTDIVTIFRYDTGGSMGMGTQLRDQPGIIERLDVSTEWLEKNVRGYTSAKNLCVVTGFGDSMKPMYNPGDPLIVDSGVQTIEFDAVYFFRVGDEGFIKRVQRVPGKGLVAISENHAYRDWTIDETMDLQVFGRVLKVWRSEDF